MGVSDHLDRHEAQDSERTEPEPENTQAQTPSPPAYSLFPLRTSSGYPDAATGLFPLATSSSVPNTATGSQNIDNEFNYPPEILNMPPGAEQLEAIDKHHERILQEARLYYMMRTIEEDRRRSEEFNRKVERLGLLGMMEEQNERQRDV